MKCIAKKGKLARTVLLSEQFSPQLSFHAGRKLSGLMSGYAFRVSCNGTKPKIMSAAVSNQAASGRLQFLDELFRFHNLKELVNNTAKVYKNIAIYKPIAIFYAAFLLPDSGKTKEDT